MLKRENLMKHKNNSMIIKYKNLIINLIQDYLKMNYDLKF